MKKGVDLRLRPARWSRRTRVADREAQRLDRILSRAEDLLDGPCDVQDVQRALRDLPRGQWLEPAFHLRAGDCFRSIDALAAGEEHYRSALTLDPHCADALHGLGLIHQLRGETEPMVDAWLEVRALDIEQRPYPWSIPADEFAAVAEDALTRIPEDARRHIDDLPLITTDYPAVELIEDGVDPRSLGLITGVPFSQKLALAGPGGELDCIQLYQRNIERVCTSREEVIEEIRITVLHETGHYFGLSEEDLEEIGLG